MFKKNSCTYIIMLSFTWLTTSAQTSQIDTNFHLFVLAGQSNMAGRGYVDSASKVVNPRIWMLNKNHEWVPATDPLHFDKKEAGVGPGISFATALLASQLNDQVKIGLIPCAVGGSSIDQWSPGSYDDRTNTHPYDDAVQRIQIAMKAGLIKGFLWHQGESDASPDKRDGYINKLADLISRFRTVFHNNEVPFIAGELGHFTESKIRFNQVLYDLPVRVKYSAVVSSAGLTANNDHLHFNTSSARELGKRYAAEFQALQSSNK